MKFQEGRVMAKSGTMCVSKGNERKTNKLTTRSYVDQSSRNQVFLQKNVTEEKKMVKNYVRGRYYAECTEWELRD